MNPYGIRLTREEKVACVTFDRPERQNALDETMWNDMARVLEDLRGNLPRAVVVTGAGGKAFCAGFDVQLDNPHARRFFEAIEGRDPGAIRLIIERIRTLTDALTLLPVPIIAAINGLAYGGGAEIASRCDLRVMDPEAVICFSEVRLGLMPDHGGAVGLTRLVGPSGAADLILTARRVSAQEALSMGLINRISAPGKALEEALSLARLIAAQGPRAVRHALKVIRRVDELTLQEALELETGEAVDLIASGECLHGVAAFLARETPVFPDPK